MLAKIYIYSFAILNLGPPRNPSQISVDPAYVLDWNVHDNIHTTSLVGIHKSLVVERWV